MAQVAEHLLCKCEAPVSPKKGEEAKFVRVSHLILITPSLYLNMWPHLEISLNLLESPQECETWCSKDSSSFTSFTTRPLISRCKNWEIQGEGGRNSWLNSAFYLPKTGHHLEITSCQAPVTHACNPSYLGGWNWEYCSSRQARWKVRETPSQPIAGHGGTCLSC
jgi:hypothetical protein